jgi:hypothetical protein
MVDAGTGPVYKDDPQIRDVKEFYRSKASLCGSRARGPKHGNNDNVLCSITKRFEFT